MTTLFLDIRCNISCQCLIDPDQCIVERSSPRSETHFLQTQQTQNKIIMNPLGHFKSFSSNYHPYQTHLSADPSTTSTTTTYKTPITTSTVTIKPSQNAQFNQFELKSAKPIDKQVIPTQIPFIIDETVTDLGIIKFPVPEILKKTIVFDQFQNRKLFLKHACKYSKAIHSKSKYMSHEERIQLQKDIQFMKDDNLEKCVPSLPLKGQKDAHFYNDIEKFSVCLPTKIGSSNWLKALASLIKGDGQYHPGQMDTKDTWGTVDRFPHKVKEITEYRRGRGPEDGYMTFLPVRHPLARLYSAWKDKFRKGHLWLKTINKAIGEYLRDFETQNMENELYEYSFEAFLEVVAISEMNIHRDKHWRSIQFFCSPCNFEYDFIIPNENSTEANKFIIWAMSDARSRTYVPSAYHSHTDAEMIRPFHSVSAAVLKDIYRNYYSDFVYFNYTIDAALAVARDHDSEDIILKRKKNRNKIKAKYLPREVNTNEDACEPILNDFGFL